MRSPRLGVKALIVREGQVLMNRYLEPDGREVFALPGGGQEHAAAAERPRWQLFDDYNARNATAAFSEIEWE